MKLTLESLPLYVDDIGDCWIWQNGVGSHGYPQAHIDGKGGTMIRTYIFTSLLNRTKPKGHVLTSSCLNKLCVNPIHIRTAPPGTVQARSYAKGLRNAAAELEGRQRARRASGQKVMSPEQVAYIRAQSGDRSNSSIAREMGLHHDSVGKIRRHQTHRNLAHGASVFAWRP